RSLVGSVIVFFGCRDAWWLRAYMPVWLVACLCAAVGVTTCSRWIGARAGHLPASLLVVAVLARFLVTTWITLLRRAENPFFVQRLYAQVSQGDTDMRDVDRPILERMRA